MDASTVQKFLLEGECTHRVTIGGQEFVFDLFPVGTRENIERQCSGLDLHARRVVGDVLDLAYCLRSIGGFDFQGSLEKKLQFVRALHEPMFELLVDQLQVAKLKRRDEFLKRADELKKSTPNPE